MACRENLADVLRQHLAWSRKNKMMMTTAASKYTGGRPLAQSAVGKALHTSTMTASPSVKVIGGEGRWLGRESLRDLCVDQWFSVGHSSAIVATISPLSC